MIPRVEPPANGSNTSTGRWSFIFAKVGLGQYHFRRSSHKTGSNTEVRSPRRAASRPSAESIPSSFHALFRRGHPFPCEFRTVVGRTVNRFSASVALSGTCGTSGAANPKSPKVSFSFTSASTPARRASANVRSAASRAILLLENPPASNLDHPSKISA